MTIAEMHIEFLIGVDKSNSLEYPDFEPEEIDVFLNKAQEIIVKTRFSGNNVKRESVEETQKRRDDLRELVENYSFVAPAIATPDNKPNGRFVDLPSDYWFMLQEDVDIVVYDCNGNKQTRNVPAKSITYDRYNMVINDPFNRPDEDFVIKLTYGNNKSEIILGGTGVSMSDDITYHMRYVKRPVEMNYFTGQGCLLADNLHREIVDYAVNIALENITSARFGTQSNELLKNE